MTGLIHFTESLVPSCLPSMDYGTQTLNHCRGQLSIPGLALVSQPRKCAANHMTILQKQMVLQKANP